MDISAHQDKKNDEYTVTFYSFQIDYLLDMLFWYRDEILRDYHSLNKKCKQISLPSFDDFVSMCDGLIMTLDDQLTNEHRESLMRKKQNEQKAKNRLEWKCGEKEYLTCLQDDYEMKKSM